MPYLAGVVKVMIASPSDVKDEREMTRDRIYEWNVRHSEQTKTVLLPIGWETHASPEMGDRPQAIINRQVLEGCDLLIAVFWTRVGSPTGVAPSGTIEEIQEHLRVGKPAMIFFSSKALPPDSLDFEQYQALLKFKEECRQEGVYETYASLEEFKQKLDRHLAKSIPELFPNSIATAISELAETFGPPKSQDISERAARILKSAAADDDGRIVVMEFEDGLTVHAGKEDMVKGCNGREKAAWKSAMKELETEDLISDVGYASQIFEVTDKGYQMASKL